MAEYIVTQKDIQLLHYSKNIHIRVYLLNEKNLIIDELEGFVTSGNGSDDATSDIRKSSNFTIHSYDSTYNIGEYNRIWLKHRVKIELGYEYFNEIIWYNKGIYIFDSCSYSYTGSTRDITFQCSDLVSSINGTHGGTLLGESFLIEGCTLNEETELYEGNDIKKVVEDLLVQNGITDYRIDTVGQVSCIQGYSTNWKQNRIDTGTLEEETNRDEENNYDDLENDHGTWHMIPYDLEFEKGITLWDVLVKIRDLYSGYEMFFDKDGTFVFQLIPICHHDSNILNHEQLNGLVISENTDIDFSSIKNATKVYGESIETDRYSDSSNFINSTIQGKNIISTVPTFETTFAYSGNIVLGLRFPNDIDRKLNENAYLTINNETYPIVLRKANVVNDENGIAKNIIEYEPMKYSEFYNSELPLSEQDMYCFKFLSTKKYWVYAGMYQIEGYIENNDDNSPFSIEKIGYRLQVLSGGDYGKIPTTTLAQERAEYENWLASRMTDTLTLEIVIIPFLEVNQKIEYKKLSDGSIDSYIVKSISYSFTSGTMTITMSKFYELDPFIVCS